MDFLIRMENVTSSVLEGSDTTSDRKLIQENIKKLSAEATKDTHYWSRINLFLVEMSIIYLFTKDIMTFV